MTELFIRVVNMSISAGWMVLAVAVLRLLLRRIPRWILPVLWGIVGVRLLLPVTVESVFSLIPSTQTIAPEILTDPSPSIHSGVYALNAVVNPVIGETFAQTAENSVPPLQVWMPVFAWIWLGGVLLLVLYMIGSTAALYRRMDGAVLYRENIFCSERVGSPFVLGVLRPRIYLPFGLSETDLPYVIAHENAHIRRRDHWIKPIGFLLLAVHWFNPLVWLAYVLLSRDIELACDERVIRDLGNEQRAAYSEALLTCSIGRRRIAACPVAFGEVSVKKRVRHVLRYRKPAVWILTASVFVCVTVALCFLTNPPEEEQDLSFLNYKTAVSQAGQQAELFAFQYAREEEAERSGIGIGGVSGRDLAVYLEGRNWTECREPRGKLYSPGSVQFVLDDDVNYRITVYDRRGLFAYASVEIQDKVRYYRAEWKDYGEAAAILHRFRQPLTLDKVTELAKKGEELTWSDFADFAYVETGSGLYIRHYTIDEHFSLLIGGPYMEEDPWYIYLEAADGYESRIDVRRDDVESFIEEHREDPIIMDCSFGWQRCAVGYSEELEKRMQDLSEGNVVGSGGTLYPAVRLDFAAELDGFLTEVGDLLDRSRAYPEESALDDILPLYDELFFAETVLFLLYCPASDSADRYDLEYAWREGDSLELGVRLADAEAGDAVMEGWLLAIGIPRKQADGVQSFYARLASSYDPDFVMPAVTAMYVLEREQMSFPNDDGSVTHFFMNPSVTLYEDGSFLFFFSPVSNYIGHGVYTVTEDRMVLTLSDQENMYYCFDLAGDTLVYDGEASTGMLWFSELQDGDVFMEVRIAENVVFRNSAEW